MAVTCASVGCCFCFAMVVTVWIAWYPFFRLYIFIHIEMGQSTSTGSSSRGSAAKRDLTAVFLRADSCLDDDQQRCSSSMPCIRALGPKSAEEFLRSPLWFTERYMEVDKPDFENLKCNLRFLSYHTHFSGINFDLLGLSLALHARMDFESRATRLLDFESRAKRLLGL